MPVLSMFLPMFVRWAEPVLSFIVNYDCVTITYKNSVFLWLESIQVSRREEARTGVQIIQVVLVMEGYCR